MNKKEFYEALTELEKEKGIDREVIIRVLEEAINQSYDKKSGEDGRIHDTGSGMEKRRRVELDRDAHEMRVYIQKEVVEVVEDESTQISLAEVRMEDPDFEVGEIVEVDITPDDFKSLGRVVAHQAKSLLIQQMKDKERELICEEFKSKVGDIVNCHIQSVETYDYLDKKTGRLETRRNVYVQVGKIEGVIEHADQIPGEEYRANTTIKAYVIELKDKRSRKGNRQSSMREPVLKLSRTHDDLLKRLLEQEVVEIASGVVELKSIARKPGQRSKIAVYSNNPKVDPVSACVGEKGGRIQRVVEELCNERIDVIRWSPILEEFVRNSLSPAKVSDEEAISIEEEEKMDGDRKIRRKVATVIVPDDQLTLAIGNRGLNVSLAAKLTSCKIDIKSEKDSAEKNRAMLSAILGD